MTSTMTDPITRNNVHVSGRTDAARTLVFVHGFGTDQSAWQPVAASLADDHRIVLLDNVGAGGSDPAAFVQHRYLNLRRYATDLNEVCAALALEHPVLVGHSVGAMICALSTLDNPGFASRLVMVGASPRYIDTDDYRGGFSKQDIDAVYGAVTTRYSEWAETFGTTALGRADHPELSRSFVENIRSIPPDRALTVLCSIFQSDHREDIAKLDLPTLVLQTREDMVVPREVAEFLHRNIRGSRLEVIDTAGHLPHVSAPALVASAIRRYLTDTAPA